MASLSLSAKMVTASGHAGVETLPDGKTLAELAGLTSVSGAGGSDGVDAPRSGAKPQGPEQVEHRTNLYRGRKLDVATTAAAAMLRRGNVDVRFAIDGDEDEIVDKINSSWGDGTVSVERVKSWVMPGGSASSGETCLVVERDDVVLGAAMLTGIQRKSSSQHATMHYFSAPLDNLGKRFLSRALRMCAGWGCRALHVQIPRKNTSLRAFCESMGYVAAQTDAKEDVLVLTRVVS